MRTTVISILTLLGTLLSTQSILAQSEIISPEDRKPGIVKIIRGETHCREPSKNDARCVSEYWSMYVHDDGSRYIHVVADNMRGAKADHAMLWVDKNGETREGYKNTWTRKGVLGSAYVVKQEETVDVAVSDLMFERADEGMIQEKVESAYDLDFLAIGPVAADGLHFFHYDFEESGEQPHGVYWMGGSQNGTMIGVIAPTTHTYLGEEEITLADGKTFTADVFKLLSGTKLWLTKEDRVLLRMDLEHGIFAGSIFETTNLEIIGIGS